ncbi:hypothetical protein D3C80_1429020 [compost metagenome]
MQRPKAGKQFLDRKGLGEVIIRSGVKTVNAVIDTSERRQNEDRHRMPGFAKRRHKVQPFTIRKATIQNQHIVRPVTRQRVGIGNRPYMIRKHITPSQGFEQGPRHFRFILEKQDSQ